MPTPPPVRLLTLVLLGAALCMPAAASAATAPTLSSPAAGAASFVEGSSMTFEWSGALQGDADTLSRSFFRVEFATTANVPSGAQSAWPDVENFIQTEPGQATSSATIGVPGAGAYKWRVCAYGVVDDVAANQLQQLPGGCSAARSFTSAAASSTGGTIGELKVENRRQVAGAVQTVYVEREKSATATPATPAPSVTAPDPVVQDVVFGPSSFQEVQHRSGGGAGNKASRSSVELGSEGISTDAAADKKSVGGVVSGGLGATLPFIPIPFWTLALLLACVPIVRAWRTSVLGMFDWADGSIDGRGTFDDVIDDLPPVAVAIEFKDGSKTVDAAAPAPAPSHSAPERGRHAA